jgi:hypothetical protein
VCPSCVRSVPFAVVRWSGANPQPQNENVSPMQDDGAKLFGGFTPALPSLVEGKVFGR